MISNDNCTVSSMSITYQGITERLSNWFNAGMEIHDTRRANLRRLIDDQFSGIAARLASALEMKPPQLHRWLAKEEAKRQNINEHSARGIEKRLSLPIGWLDREEDGTAIPAASVALPPELQAVNKAYQSGGPAKQAALAQLAAIPEQEMALILLMLQSIKSKYPEQTQPFVSENLKNAERMLLKDLHESSTEATDSPIFIERRKAQ